MKRFITRISIVTLITISILVVLDVGVSALLHKSTEQRYVVWNEIRQRKINADMLIMGNSRAEFMYSPKILDSILHISTYNIGVVGCTFNTQNVRYNIYRMYHEETPKIIIQNIDFSQTLNHVVGFQNEQFFPYFYDKTFMAEVNKGEPFSWLEYNIPFYRYCRGFKILRILKGIVFQDDYVLEKGFYANIASWDQNAIEQIDSLYFECDSHVKDSFCNYVEQVKKDGIQIVFVYAPYHISAISKVVNLDECYHTFDSIAHEFDVPILDYTYSSISYDTAYFYNASHLNKQGAELFSTMLANDLDSLGIIH